jgi:putative FmdB family regulatory protein
MPLYEYHCEKCGQDFEVRHGMEDPPLKKHDDCGGRVTQKFSTSSLQFKGTGFYETDYKNK